MELISKTIQSGAQMHNVQVENYTSFVCKADWALASDSMGNKWQYTFIWKR